MKASEVGVGDTFGRWTVLEPPHKGPNDHPYVLCGCECGTEKEVNVYSMIRGDSSSCGCYRRENCGNQFRTHGLTGHPLHGVWMGMVQRCTDTRSNAFQWYGARGIKMCPEWVEDFANFYEWALDNDYEEGLTIERIDNDGDYEPSNCTWITLEEQAANRQDTLSIEAFGETKNLTEWSKDSRCTVSTATLWRRIRQRGMDPEEAIATPNMRKRA